MANININRNDNSFNKYRNVYLFIDDKKYNIKPKAKLNIELPLGTYEVYTKIDWYKSKKLNLKIKENKNYNLNIISNNFDKRKQTFLIIFNLITLYFCFIKSNVFYYLMPVSIIMISLSIYINFYKKEFIKISFE